MRIIRALLLSALLVILLAGAASAQESTVPVSSTADIVSALSKATSGDKLTFVFQSSVLLDSSLYNHPDIVIPAGVTATFTNAPGKAVTVTRQYVYDFDSIPYSPMVTVNGTLIIEENASGGGSLSFTGGDQYFFNKPMFQVEEILTVRSGAISDARGRSGGAICAGDTSTVNISSGSFTNCVAQDSGSGGAICAYGNLNITGGTFSGNDATMGGAVYYSGSSSTLFTMTGGTMTGNGKTSVWGGAIIVAGGKARITGGTFTGNTTTAWGGAIYVELNAELFMARVLAFDNHSTLQGGGIFNCGTGSGSYNKFCGMTLYRNTSSGDSRGYSCGDDFYSYKKEPGYQSVYVSDYTLNGTKQSWYKDEVGARYQDGDTPADTSYYQNTKENFALKSGATNDDYDASDALAWVKLSGNSAASGGAIANNGTLTIGYVTALEIRKIANGGPAQTLFPFEITLTDALGNPYSAEVRYLSGNEERTLVFDANGKATLQIGGGKQATLYDLPLGFHYQVTEIETSGYTLVASTGTSGVLDAEKATAIFMNESDESGQPGGPNDPLHATTDFYVVKRWEGDDKGAISLTLYANGKKLDPQPACTRSGNVYTFFSLPKYDSAKSEIVYSAKERYYNGYMTIYANNEPWEKETDAIYNGGTIINRAATSLSVRKVWTGLDGEAPAITLTLFRNGEVYRRRQPKPNENGVYTYTNLPLMANGAVAEYYLVETPMSGYVTTYDNPAPHSDISDRAYSGGVITNRKVPKTGDDDAVWACWATAAVSLLMLVLLGARGYRKRRCE